MQCCLEDLLETGEMSLLSIEMWLLSLDHQLNKGDQGNVQSQTKHGSFSGRLEKAYWGQEGWA